jgi:hypothetical protein
VLKTMAANIPLYLQVMEEAEKRIKARVEALERERKEKERERA